MEFDSFHIRFGGINDAGCHDAKVIVGLADNSGLNRSNIQIDMRFQADLDAPLRELREQVKALALDNLRKALKLLESNSSDQLHLKAQDALSERMAAGAEALDKSILGIGNNFTLR